MRKPLILAATLLPAMAGCQLAEPTSSFDERLVDLRPATAEIDDDRELLPANNANIHEKPVQFDDGAFGTTLAGAVIRGDRDLYVLQAKADQELILNIASWEDNAVFDVLAPDETLIVDEARDAAVPLPETGSYKVVVGGTRGNATYTLNILIRPATFGTQ